MSKPLRVVFANQTFEALIAYADVLAGKQAIFVAPAVVGSELPSFSPPPETVEDHIAAIVESSGSTGVPKRIKISLAALLHAAKAGSDRLGPQGQWLLALPINFIAGQQVLIRSLLSETQPVMMNTAVPFTADAFFRSASLMRETNRYTSLVPTQLARLLDAAESSEEAAELLRGFRAILVGGQSLPTEALNRAEALGLRVVQSYGMTETAGGCVYDGIPLEGVKLKINPEGRLMVAGKTLAENLGEWLTTNDLAELSAEGRLDILGRADRVIISGGLKISLDRIEYLGTRVLGVEELAATSIADQEFGERVGICYVGSPEVADTIVNEMASVLGPAGKPVRVIRVDRIPNLATGKVDRIAIDQIFRRDEN
jgi:o-succinylbenzoate---CoA ligase